MSHVDATAVLLTKLVAPDRGGDEQGARVSRAGGEEPIRIAGVLALSALSVKNRGVRRATANSLTFIGAKAEDRGNANTWVLMPM